MTVNLRTELLFPPHLIRELRDLRGDAWRELVDSVAGLPETDPNTLAFCLMMIRLNACLGCVSGSYRFMRGCELCTQQTISRFQGTDEELVALFHQARYDLDHYNESPIDLVPETPEPEIVE